MKEDHETNQFIISLHAFNSSLLNVVLNKLKKKMNAVFMLISTEPVYTLCRA